MSSRLAWRFLWGIAFALATGIGGNFLYDFFTFRLGNAVDSQFKMDNIFAYFDQLSTVLFEPNRLEVVVGATLVYELMHAGPVHYARLYVTTPLLEQTGIPDETIEWSWRQYQSTLHWRLLYRASSLLDAAIVGWVSWVMFMACNPNQIVSWLKFKQNVKAPWFIVTDILNYPGILLVFLTGGDDCLGVPQHYQATS